MSIANQPHYEMLLYNWNTIQRSINANSLTCSSVLISSDNKRQEIEGNKALCNYDITSF